MGNTVSEIGAARVAVTGMGCIVSAGNGVDALWDGVLQRRCAISRASPGTSPVSSRSCHWQALVDDDVMRSGWPGPDKPGADRAANLLTVAAEQALLQAGLRRTPELGDGVAVIIGSGAGPTEALFEAYRTFFEKGARRMRPTVVPRCMANSLSARIAIRYGLTGPNYVVVSACASSTVAIGTAARMIRCGMAERVLCGGVETVSDPVTTTAWERLGALTRSRDPDRTVLPYDLHRDGFVLAEGAGALLLESFDAARRRGAAVYGEIAGYGESSDATHITRPNAEGEARAMKAALDDARVTPDAVGVVLGHGTATVAADRAECAAINNVFGEDAGNIPVLSLKALWGHLLGASGVVESIAGLMMLHSRTIPPDPLPARTEDPECRLRFGPQTLKRTRIDYLMKNSFAFGGNNAVLVFRDANL